MKVRSETSFRLILLLAALALLAGVAWAQAPEQHDLSWHVVGAGGQDSASAGHQVRGTLGQLAIGPAAAPSGHQVGSGYWVGVGRAAPVWRVYLPLVLRNAGR